jgi:diguanylate cyclase (GGDEF)-like protein
MPGSSLPFHTFPPDLEARYLQRTATALRPKTRTIGYLLAACVVAFGAYDYYLRAATAPLALTLRILAAVVVLAVLEWVSRREVTPWLFRICLAIITVAVIACASAALLISGAKTDAVVISICLMSTGFALFHLRVREGLLVMVGMNLAAITCLVLVIGPGHDLPLALTGICIGAFVVLVGGSHLESVLRSLFLLETAAAEEARRDPLTGVLNRRAIETTLETDWDRGTASLIMIDLDHFKHVNDSLGHGVGDDVLRACAEAWGTSVRDGDLLGRLGGEEFFFVLPRTDADEARAIAERLRASTESLEVGGVEGRLTASFGVVEWRPDEPWEDALRRADRALYLAKDSGRNRVIAA